METVEIFIVSYRKDAEWCYYNLRSIKKYCTGFSGTTVLVPHDDIPIFKSLVKEFGITLLGFDEKPGKGQVHHQAMKCSADLFCKSDFILHTDSDCCFTEPVTPADYLTDGKPLLLKIPFAGLGIGEPNSFYSHWQRAAQAALGFEVLYETMGRHPTVHYRWLYKQVRDHIENHVQMPFLDYVLAQKNEFPQTFAEFTTLGAYVIKYHSDKYTWCEAKMLPDRLEMKFYPDCPKSKLTQKWSHAGITPEVRAELDRVTS